MKLHITYTNEQFEDGLIMDSNNNYKVVGKIEKATAVGERINSTTIRQVQWFINPTDLVITSNTYSDGDEEEETISLRIGASKNNNSIIDNVTITDSTIVTGKMDELTASNVMNRVIKGYPTDVFVTEDTFVTFENAALASRDIKKLYDKSPIYKNIIMFDDNDAPYVTTLVDILFMLPTDVRNDYILALRYSNGYISTMRALADRILEAVNIQNGKEYMTQEQQVEAFINFSKLVANEKEEIVTDADIEMVQNSPEYAKIVESLSEHGFGLSETQQFNVLQAAIYFSQYVETQRVIYNLSDMGAGKTLMTVESIALLDHKTITTFEASEERERVVTAANTIKLPNKNLVAPKLSVKSSWVDTFKLFYDVEEISDSEYRLTLESNGVLYVSSLNISAFTARNNAVVVDNTLPDVLNGKEYLIIDEVHQLLERKMAKTKFFAKDVSPHIDYKSFVLSGTLSNLTTEEWFNYVHLMGLPFGISELDTYSPSQQQPSISGKASTLKQDIKESAQNISVDQKRYFDPSALITGQTVSTPDKEPTNKVKLFNQMYASKVIVLDNDDEDIQDALVGGRFTTQIDSNIITTPNFELFYQLVGHCAITAQSTQIAEELFGEQKTQHNADVINTPSTLSGEDLLLLRTLHNITTDYKIYKSQAIATAINNAILNLNDGLATKNIYELLTKYAASNIRFLEYLSTLDLDILQRLPESGLINQPKLEDTPKFEVLTDILENEKDETHLIVVNDYQAMKKLSTALEIESLTQKDVRNQLDYQEVLDAMFEKQSIVVVPQMMIKSSLDLVQANRLIQYQLNTEISDIIQTQNRINRIGQTRETKAYYIATDILQKNIIDLFLETYKNIRVAHKGIVELFVDMSSQVNVVNDYISKAMLNIDIEDAPENPQDAPEVIVNKDGTISLFDVETLPEGVNEPIEGVAVGLVESEPVTPGQMNLFPPIEMASNHQLRSAVSQ